jgi:hypothetical protein
MHMTPELWFHAVEILVLIFGIAMPAMWGAFRLAMLVREYPPHRHINGKIVFPKGYEPSEVVYDKRP